MSIESVIARIQEIQATGDVGDISSALSRAVLWCEKNFDLPYTKRKEELVVIEGSAPVRGSIIRYVWDGKRPLIPSDTPVDVQEKAATAFFWDGDKVFFNGTTTQVVAIYDTFTDLVDGHWLLVHAEDLLVSHVMNYIGELLNDSDLLLAWQGKIALENKLLLGMLQEGRNKRSSIQQFATTPQVVLQGPPGLVGPAGESIVGPAGPASTVPGPVGGLGPRGPIGLQGPIGPASTVIGPAGNDGLPGERGLRGHSGATGATGRPGFNGQNGAIGPQGPTGARGAIGPHGPTGPRGITGPVGGSGSTGVKGDKGDAGEVDDIATIAARSNPLHHTALRCETSLVDEDNPCVYIESGYLIWRPVLTGMTILDLGLKVGDVLYIEGRGVNNERLEGVVRHLNSHVLNSVDANTELFFDNEPLPQEILTAHYISFTIYPTAPEVVEAESELYNPYAFRRTLRAGEQPHNPDEFSVLHAEGYYRVRMAFGFLEERLANQLLDDISELNLNRENQHNLRVDIDQTRKIVYQSEINGQELFVLEVQIPDADAAWLEGLEPGDVDFYVIGLHDDQSADSLELAIQARLAALAGLEILFRSNRSTANVDDTGDDGTTKANRFDPDFADQWVFLPNDEDFELLREAHAEGRLDAIHLAANTDGSRQDIDTSAPNLGATYVIDDITFATESSRTTTGNRIAVKFREDIADVWRDAPGRFFFVASFKTLDNSGLANDFGLYYYYRISTNPATATDKVVNLGLVGDVNGVVFSADPDQLIALRASGYEPGDIVEMAAYNGSGKHINGAYIQRTDFSVLTYDDVNGTASLQGPAFPSAFSDSEVDRISIRIRAGTKALRDTELYELMLRETATSFVRRVDGADPTEYGNTIQRTNNKIRWGAGVNERANFVGLGIQRGDRVVIRPFNAAGVWLNNKSTKQWDSWTDFRVTRPYIEISQDYGQPLSAIWLRQAAYLHVKLIPGFRSIRDSRLSAKVSGLHYHRPVVTGIPSATNQGIYFAPNTRTIYLFITDAKRTQLESYKLSAYDKIEILTEGENGRELGTGLRTLFRPPTFGDGVVVFQFLDAEDLLPSSLTNAFYASVIIAPVEVAKKPWVEQWRWAGGTTPGISGEIYPGLRTVIDLPFNPEHNTEFQFLAGTDYVVTSPVFTWPVVIPSTGWTVNLGAGSNYMEVVPNVGSTRRIVFVGVSIVPTSVHTQLTIIAR